MRGILLGMRGLVRSYVTFAIPAKRTTQPQNKHTQTSVTRVSKCYSCMNILKIIGHPIMCKVKIQLVSVSEFYEIKSFQCSEDLYIGLLCYDTV
jgi:hypothetical protein